jgi:4-hydroxybenzoate polyprenyltransferase
VLPRIVVAAVLAFAVTLAAIIGTRMTVETIAVVVGFVCGVAASIPMSLLTVLVSARQDARAEEKTHRPINTGRPSPPVVLIQGGAPGHNQPTAPFYSNPAAAYDPAQRTFHIVGQSED